MHYKPGLHILSEFNAGKPEYLFSFESCKVLFDGLIVKYRLSKVGEVYHNFDGGGFTAVVCLTESHLSIHTWPEFKLATFDVFLSNYQKDNEDKVRGIYAEVLAFFEASERQKTELTR
ncbi:S-adenosylmethionine decarboxylase family protein [Pedobacter africanus]|uniref:S-adenosylmethionine decarboxylase n=1 Tax=Pedobacter africanus TaxID=151894 RepID=A0A1W2EAQ5_9SPHI|nr:S-adenosylmethionine decarboxylase [Pedobacter africanus]SMD06814.1 S-adenosylmethionine decarboxylase [Pedobacter africanus]